MKLAVAGGGSWGTALALQAARCGHDVRLWMRDAAAAHAMRATRENARYLPGIALPANLQPTADLADAIPDAELVVFSVPSEHSREVYRRVAPLLRPGALLVSATKGFEIPGLARMSEVAAAEAPNARVAVLSGPSFAEEVAVGQPTAVVAASLDAQAAEEVQRALSNRVFRIYASADVVGVEVSGALKNVIAIAAGAIDGLGFGHNTVAALVTRGLAEMSRLATAMGGRPETLAGLAGLGDLVLTCTGGLSRNRRLGQALGSGRSLREALAASNHVVEGVRTTLSACALAERHGVDMPIAAQMKAVVHDGKPPREALEALMLRSLKRE